MAWETDKVPLDYLKQRIKYYKKKKSTVKNLRKSGTIVERYGGEEKFQELVKERLKEIDWMTDQYKEAALILENVNRDSLRHLVDVIWGYVYEDESVPSTHIADQLIDKVLKIE